MASLVFIYYLHFFFPQSCSWNPMKGSSKQTTGYWFEVCRRRTLGCITAKPRSTRLSTPSWSWLWMSLRTNRWKTPRGQSTRRGRSRTCWPSHGWDTKTTSKSLAAPTSAWTSTASRCGIGRSGGSATRAPPSGSTCRRWRRNGTGDITETGCRGRWPRSFLFNLKKKSPLPAKILSPVCTSLILTPQSLPRCFVKAQEEQSEGGSVWWIWQRKGNLSHLTQFSKN